MLLISHFAVGMAVLGALIFASWLCDAKPKELCTTDEECFPSSCCHATGCVSKEHFAQDCSGVLCNAVCKPFTLDCGGECRCFGGNCSSVIRAGRPPPGVEFRPPTDPPKTFQYVKVKRVVSVPRSQARALKNKN